MTIKYERYHGMKIPYDENGLLAFERGADGYSFTAKGQAAYDRYIDLKVKHGDVALLTDYQIGNWFDRHPGESMSAAKAKKAGKALLPQQCFQS